MALVTITGDLVRDASGRPDTRPWTTRAATYQDGGGGGVITPGEKVTEWWPKAGVVAIRVEAGIKFYIGNPDGREYLVTAPAEDDGLWDVIEAGQAYTPDTTQEQLNTAVGLYVETNREQFIAHPYLIESGPDAGKYQYKDGNDIPVGDPVELIVPEAVATAAATAAANEVTPGIVTTDLQARQFTHEDDGEGGWYIAADGVPLGESRPAPATVWSALIGPPAINTASESTNGLAITHEGDATGVLRLDQQGDGYVSKWRSGGADRGFINNGGDLKLVPADDARGLMVEGLDWQSGRPNGFLNKDYVIGVSDFRDYAGEPIYNGVFGSYTQIFGATARKYGPGNMNAFWSSIHSYGPDEVRICVGGANSHNGGHSWGFDFRAYADTHDTTIFGGFIGVKPGAPRTKTVNGVAGTSLASTTLAADAEVGAMTISCVANPGTGRFSIGSNPELEYISIGSVSGSGPYTATLATPLSYAHASGQAVTIYGTQVIGLRVTNEANNPGDIALWLDTKPGATGEWAEVIRFTNGAGTTAFQVFPTGEVRSSTVRPYASGNHDLGTSSVRWRALYANKIVVNGANTAGSAGTIGLQNAAILPTSIPTTSTVLYGDTGRLMATGGIGGRVESDGATVVRMQTERPWNFKQIGWGGVAASVPDASDKLFDIASPSGNKLLELVVHDTAASQKIGFFGAASVVKQTVAAAATDAATTQTLVNSIRTALINYGLAV